MATFFGSPLFVSTIRIPVARTQSVSLPPQLPSLSNSSPETPPPPPPPLPPVQRGGRGTSADSTDWIASGLTRRFGLGAGLAWAGFLAFGVVSEQIKTRFEVNQQEANTRFVMQ